MTWSISDVARLTGVTSRTLRHYDRIGLLRPAFLAASGYRHYERAQLLRLQQILLLRALGLGLDAIGAVLDDEADQVPVLQRHHQHLQAEGRRLARLATAVSRTIDDLQGGPAVTAEQMFDGFPQRRDELEERLAERYGDGVREYFTQSRERTGDWTPQDLERMRAEGERHNARLLEAMRAGLAAEDDEVLELMAEHHAGVRASYDTDRTAYENLGRLYVEDPQVGRYYAALDPALPAYVRDAVLAYARLRLDPEAP